LNPQSAVRNKQLNPCRGSNGRGKYFHLGGENNYADAEWNSTLDNRAQFGAACEGPVVTFVRLYEKSKRLAGILEKASDRCCFAAPANAKSFF
jgi:hypothetical protein